MISKNNLVVWMEILLVVSLSFSISYMLGEGYGSYEKAVGDSDQVKLKDKLMSFYNVIVKGVFDEKNLASAQEQEAAVYTCIRGQDGAICQEYPVIKARDINVCNAACDGTCIPSPRRKIAECKIGTCYDSFEGTCSAGSPKARCEEFNGEWFNDPFENIPQCREGCCILGDQTKFVSEKQCGRQSELLGLERDFRPEINTEIACLGLSRSQVEGACVFEEEFQTTCRFTTKAGCLGINGEFREGLLCSNKELNTNCERQEIAKCVEGKDELYWFDSCGNKENIYDSNKGKSWNNGKVLLKEDSCSLGSSSDPLKNQRSCGNCNYITGSVCGDKTKVEKLSDGSLDYVCRDLRCDVDGNGKKDREHGESWCKYQGAIGVDGKEDRSVDTPGSRHFRQTCINGEIRTEGCADYRNEICVEAQNEKAAGGKFSSAACRINRWQQCLEYNTKDPSGVTQKTEELCTKNDDCFIKNVNVAEQFNFNICAPKYPSGFNLDTNGKAVTGLCNLASQKCTVVYQKKLSGWDCVANCACEGAAFTEQMNNLCISLGDCGASANYIGEVSENYKVNGAPKLSEKYLSDLEKYSERVEGEFVKATGFKGGGSFGFIGGSDFEGAKVPMMAAVAGAIGIIVPLLPIGFDPIEALASEITSKIPGLSGLGGSFANLIDAGLAFYSVYSIAKFAIDIDDPAALGLVIGAIGSIAVIAPFVDGIALFPGIGIAALILFIIFKILGIGKTKEVVVQFTCQPWQAPTGGDDCVECGEDGLPCSRYSCNSLGQTCEFINEGSGQELCVDIAPDDVTAPRISLLEGVLTEGFEYEDISDRGFKIESSGNDGCVKAYQELTFGIKLNEPGQCVYDSEHTTRFEDMEFSFGDTNLFLWNHTQMFNIPSLESLGLPGFDPNRKADYNLFVRCQDKSGNSNTEEFAINFCVKPGDDITAPLIKSHEPRLEFVQFNATEQDVVVWTNEPAECKWDESDKFYEDMENEFTCANGFNDQELNGFKCDSVFPIEDAENAFYVRCLDQPWLKGGEREGDRNANVQSNVINLKRSSSALMIDSITPNDETIVAGVEPVSVEVIIRTSGGVDGTAQCSYGFEQEVVIDSFFDTFSSEHRQFFQTLFSGDKTIYVECEDAAGNFASGTGRFKVEIDVGAPRVTRVYNQGGSLIVVTDEKSECAFVSGIQKRGRSQCGFEFDEGEVMSGVDLTHSTSFNSGLTHYIKCKDRFGNSPGSCSIIVRGGV